MPPIHFVPTTGVPVTEAHIEGYSDAIGLSYTAQGMLQDAADRGTLATDTRLAHLLSDATHVKKKTGLWHSQHSQALEHLGGGKSLSQMLAQHGASPEPLPSPLPLVASAASKPAQTPAPNTLTLTPAAPCCAGGCADRDGRS